MLYLLGDNLESVVCKGIHNMDSPREKLELISMLVNVRSVSLDFAQVT